MLGGPGGSPPWEGEAPAEPKSIARVQLPLLADNRRPGIPARQPCAPTKPQRTLARCSAIPWVDNHQANDASASSPSWCSVVVAWASALVVTHKMGCLRCISAVATREILDFRLAKRKRPYPPVVVNKCCGCKFKDEFGNSHPRIQEDLQDLIAGHGG